MTPGDTSGTGLILDLQPGDRAELERRMRTDPALAIVAARVLHPNDRSPDRDTMLRRYDELLTACARRRCRTGDLDRLRASFIASSTETARSMIAVLGLALAGTPFVMARIGTAGAALPDGHLERLEGILGLGISTGTDLDRLTSHSFVRPAHRPLDTTADQLLMQVLLGPADEVAGNWSAWQSIANVDEQPGFDVIAPIIEERLGAAGVVDAESGRLHGLRRRAWYMGGMLRTDAAEAIGLLRSAGIDPTLTGDLPAAVGAAIDGAVRTVRDVSLLIDSREVAGALDALAPMVHLADGDRQVAINTIARDGWIHLPTGPSRRLVLRSRWLSQNCASLLPLPTADRPDPITIEAEIVDTLSPSARLIELWCGDRLSDPGRWLAVATTTGEHLRRHHRSIDWALVLEACRRLDLIGVAAAQLDSLPPSIRASVPPMA